MERLGPYSTFLRYNLVQIILIILLYWYRICSEDRMSLFFPAVCLSCNYLYVASHRYFLPERCPRCSTQITLLDPEEFSQEFKETFVGFSLPAGMEPSYFACLPIGEITEVNSKPVYGLRDIIADCSSPKQLVTKLQSLE